MRTMFNGQTELARREYLENAGGLSSRSRPVMAWTNAVLQDFSESGGPNDRFDPLMDEIGDERFEPGPACRPQTRTNP